MTKEGEKTSRELLRELIDKIDGVKTDMVEMKIHNHYTQEKLKLVDKHEKAYAVYSVGRWIFGGLSLTELGHLIMDAWKK